MEPIPITELKGKAGYELPPLMFDIERGLVNKFAAAVGDLNSRWETEAPPSLIPALGFDQVYEILASAETVAVLHGATDVEFIKPVNIGDTIVMKAVISSARERRTENGITVFVNFNISYINQEAAVVANCRQTALVTRHD
jgi:acyl dehydratase